MPSHISRFSLREGYMQMYLYDVFGILSLIFTGAFLLFLPLAAVASLVWIFDKVKRLIESHRAGAHRV